MLNTLTGTAARKARQFKVSVRERGLMTTLYWSAFGYLKPNEFSLFETSGRETGRFDPTPDIDYEIWSAERLAVWRRGRGRLLPELFQDEIDGVRSCAIARRGDAVAGLIWIYDRDDTSRLFRLGPGDFELNYGTVLPDYRRQHLFTNVLRFAASSLATRGCRRVYAGVHVDNIASRRAFERAGFRPTGSITQVAFFRPRWATAA
jgi:ribosomal protein S18 acetylase RimI-like enzyme